MGINLIDQIVPKNSGSFAMVSDEYILGGWRSVADTSSRDAIPATRQRQGMRVYVQDEDKTYQLSGSSWNEVPGGGAGGTEITGTVNFFVDETLDVYGLITNTTGPLILSSSDVALTGNLDIVGNLTVNGEEVSTDVTGSDNFFVNNILDARGVVDNTIDRLILTSSQGLIVLSGSVELSKNEEFKVYSVNTGISVRFADTSGNGMAVKNRNWILSPSIKMGFNNTANIGGGNPDTYIFRDGAAGVVKISDSLLTGSTLEVGRVVNDLGHLILSSSVGSKVTVSGNLDVTSQIRAETLNVRLADPTAATYAQIGRKGTAYFIITEAEPRITVAQCDFGFSDGIRMRGHSRDYVEIWDKDTNYKIEIKPITGSIVASNGHLILSSSAGSYVTVSGNLDVKGQIDVGSENAVIRWNAGGNLFQFLYDGINTALNVGSSYTDVTGEIRTNSNKFTAKTGNLILSSSVGSTVHVSGNLAVEEDFDVLGELRTNRVTAPTDYLILSSSGGSNVTVSGTFKVVGSDNVYFYKTTNPFWSTLVCGDIRMNIDYSGNAGVTLQRDTGLKMGGTTGKLIAWNTAGQGQAGYKGFKIEYGSTTSPNTLLLSSSYGSPQFTAESGELILSSSVGSQVTVSGNLQVHDTIYGDDNTTASLRMNNTVGSQLAYSSTHLNVVADRIDLYAADVFRSVDRHLVLSSSAGSYVTISGSMKLSTDSAGVILRAVSGDSMYLRKPDNSTPANLNCGSVTASSQLQAGTFAAIRWNGRAILDSTSIEEVRLRNGDTSAVLVAVAGSGTIVDTDSQVIDTFLTSSYRTIEYLISAISGNFYQSEKIIVVHDDSEVNLSEYGIITAGTEDPFVFFEAAITGSDVDLRASGSAPEVSVKVFRTAIPHN